MKIRSLVFYIFIFGIITAGKAQKIYNLNDCISTGLERNFSLLIARNTEAISKNNFTKGNAGFMPSVSLYNQVGGTVNNSIQNLSEGGQNTNSGIHNQSLYSSVSMNWTLFEGFNVQTTFKKLNELDQLGTLRTQLSVEYLVADLIAAYYNFIQQVQMQINLNYAIKLSKERLRIDEERYLLGSSSKLEVLQSRVYLNADSSRLSKHYETLRSAQVKLNELMGVEEIANEFSLQDSSILVNPELQFEILSDQAMLKNTGLQISKKNQNLSTYDYQLVMSRTYPYLNLYSGYSISKNVYETGTYTNSLSHGMNYGITFGINIFDGFNQKRNLSNATIDIKNKELEYRKVEQVVKADLITLFNAYSNHLRLIKLEEQNLQTASENLEIALEKYKLGSLSGIELREVQKSLLDAKESLVSVQYQTKLAEVSLQLISGNIMNYYK